MTLTFRRLCDDGVLGPIHRAFGELLQRLDPDIHPQVQLAGALASEQLARGHVCFDLQAAEQLTFASDDSGENVKSYRDWPKLPSWTKELQRAPLVDAFAAGHIEQVLDRPIVFDAEHKRIYLARFWYLQQQLAGWIAERVKSPPLALDRSRLANDVAALFPYRERESDRDQYAAVLTAAARPFAVVTGGPGTGKTTTVAKLLAARLMQTNDRSGALRIILMAPTGKAAQRLNESLARATASLPRDVLNDSLRTQLQAVTAGTIHRLLNWTPAPPERGGPFRKGPRQPLDADIVLVDEASMVDLELMWHLFAALRPETQIVLMGDRDQLASVEAGGVLSDLCGELVSAPGNLVSGGSVSGQRHATVRSLFTDADLALAAPVPKRRRSQPEVTSVTNVTSLPAAVSWLRYSHRFSGESDLGQLALAIREGDADAVVARLKQSSKHVSWISTESSESALRQVVEQAAGRYHEYLDALQAAISSTETKEWGEVLHKLSNVRVLCAHRDGAFGERALNQRLTQHFANQGLLRLRPGAYLGQAVIITENDYRQNLFNGDVGVVVPTTLGTGLALAVEDASDQAGGIRLIPAALAPAHRDCWAMTIHKSQGSEFGAVFIVLPEFESPVLSRELLYTAVTRVKDTVDPLTQERRPGFLCLAAREDVLRTAITRGIRRTSGLRDAINAQIEQVR